MKNAIIIGSGNLGQVFLSYLQEEGYNILGFYDKDKLKRGQKINGIFIIGTFRELNRSETEMFETHFFCAIGNNYVRSRYLSKLRTKGYETPNFIHSSVIINKDVQLGESVYLFPGVKIMPYTKIEDNVIISTGCNIAHHTIIQKGVYVSTGVNIGANIIIKREAFLGIGCTIMTGVSEIGENSVIGCGAVVISDVSNSDTVIGVPAKPLLKKPNTNIQSIKDSSL